MLIALQLSRVHSSKAFIDGLAQNYSNPSGFAIDMKNSLQYWADQLDGKNISLW